MTKEQSRLSRRYVIYRTLTSMWFVGAIWLYFYRIFITDQQVGFLDGMAFAIGLVAEVPSGALADKFGRDKIVRIGQILAGCGLLIQAFGNSFAQFFTGQAILMIGLSFVSGADEALFFERLKFDKKSTNWRKLVTRASQIGLIGSFLATVSGGFLHNIEPRLPWILNGLAFIASASLIWTVKDDRPQKARKGFMPEIRDYLLDIRTGFAQFRLPKLWLYLPFILTVQGLFYATGYGLLRLILLDRFHFSPLSGSIVIATSSLITAGFLGYMHKNADSLSEKKVLTIIGLLAGSSLLLSLANIGWWGYIVILFLHAGEHILQPFLSEVLNNQAPEKQRATVLSVASFFKALPYVFLAPIIGYLSANNKMEYFFIAWALLVFGSILLYLSTRKKDAHLRVTE